MVNTESTVIPLSPLIPIPIAPLLSIYTMFSTTSADLPYSGYGPNRWSPLATTAVDRK
jgi:hypothetical protein